MNKKALYENIISNNLKHLNENRFNQTLTKFQIFAEALWMNNVDCGAEQGTLEDYQPDLDVLALGLEKMFQYQYSENDKTLAKSIELAKRCGYLKFIDVVKANSIEAKQRYLENHIRKVYVVTTTRDWTCTIEADNEGYCWEFGGERETKEIKGNTAKENFKIAFKDASEHLGPLMPKKQYENASIEEIKNFTKNFYNNKD